jgi:hypothetical protein
VEPDQDCVLDDAKPPNQTFVVGSMFGETGVGKHSCVVRWYHIRKDWAFSFDLLCAFCKHCAVGIWVNSKTTLKEVSVEYYFSVPTCSKHAVSVALNFLFFGDIMCFFSVDTDTDSGVKWLAQDPSSVIILSRNAVPSAVYQVKAML